MRALILAALAFAAPAAAAESPYDLLIRGAAIIDGTGAPARKGDVLVRGDEIVIVGEAPAGSTAARVIDAAGRVLSPGFIDPHAHGQALDMAQPFENFLAMGVTTIVLGQDGSSPDGASIAGGAPTLSEWFARLERTRPPLNMAALIGFGSVRTESGAPHDAAASTMQIAAMVELIDRGLAAGAFGVSLGMEYVPMIHATRDELRAVAKAAARHDGIVMSHMRSEDDDRIKASIDELLEMGAFARVHVSHVKVVYGKSAAQGRAVLDQLAAARGRGVRVSADVYPYLASHTGIAILFPQWAKTRADFERALPARRKELEAYLRERVSRRGGPEATLLSTPPYVGSTLAGLAREKGTSFVDVLIDDIGPQGASAAYFVMGKEVQDQFIISPEIMIGTDGAPGMFHPRGYGTYARIIETYVGKEGLPLPLAVKKMTSMPAAVLNIPDRGVIRAGAKADLVLFDPRNVRETATWDSPQQLARGFDVVIVNGKIVRENETLSPVRAGKVLRRR
ncbi:MAG: amidohydrolase family protein [Rhodospirillaceae bacterium]